jgi:hypothetical protein
VHSLSAVALATACALAAAPARADADPDDLITRPLVLAPGAVAAELHWAINLQQSSFGTPMAVSPDAWVGILLRLTIGLFHSDASLDQIAASGSFCVRQVPLAACHQFYQGSGIDVRYSAIEGPIAIVPRLRVLLRDIDPPKPATTLGAMLRWTHGRFAIQSDPYLRLPLANGALGNRSAIMLPLWLAVQPAARWLVALRTGFASDLAVIHDGGHVAFAADAATRITDQVDLGLEVGWASLIGPQHDARHAAITVTAGWHD